MSAVFDSSAVLALLQNEPGATELENYPRGSLMSAVNAAEVVTKLRERSVHEEAIRVALKTAGLRIVPFDDAMAYVTGLLRLPSRAFGLSLGDRACLALALREKLPVVTTDRAWRNVDLGVEIRVIR